MDDPGSPVIPLETPGGSIVLVDATGAQTGLLASSPRTPIVRSTFGKRLFGILDYSPGEPGDPTPVVIAADGSWTALGSPIPRGRFVDAIGASDGTAWAEVTVTNDCTTADRATITEASRAGAHLLAVLPGVEGEWVFLSYTRAGIVVQAQACTSEGPTIATELVDPVSGRVTNLASRMGFGCSFVSGSDSGKLVCIRVGSAPSLEVVDSDGARREFVLPSGAALCGGGEMGDGLSAPEPISDDGKYLAASYICMTPGANGGRNQLLIISTASGKVTEGPESLYLDGVEWLPDDRLVACRPIGLPPGGTWVVATDGTAVAISSAGSAQL